MTSTVTTWTEDGGSTHRVRLQAGRGNVLTRAVLRELRRALGAVPDTAAAVLLDGEGADTCFGASVEEHLPGEIEDALPEFHDTIRALLDTPRPLVGVLRGRCLGGGLELAACCDRLFAARDVVLGQPEIRLGVFAPAASLLLPARVGEPRARELLLSGRTVAAGEALACGLVDVVAGDPEDAARGWVRRHLAPSSPSSLGLAARAARLALRARVVPLLDEVERLYLDELMATGDAGEGLRAFLEKRAPRWGSAP